MNEEVEQTTVEAPANKYPLASRLQRFIAVLIDNLIVLSVMSMFIANSDYSQEIIQKQQLDYGDELLFFVAIVLIFLLLNIYFLSRYGQTIGKRIVKIAIVDVATDRILPLEKVILYRYAPIWLIAVIPLIGFVIQILDIMFIFRPDRRCIHDHIAGTKVINVRSPN